MHGGVSRTAERDLARYYALLERERSQIALTAAEAELVCGALENKTLEIDDVNPLWAWVADYGYDSGAKEDLGVDYRKLLPKLRRLSLLGQLAVLDAAQSYALDRRWVKGKQIKDCGLVRRIKN